MSPSGFLLYVGAGLAQPGLGEPLALPHGSSEDSAECLVWTWWAQSPGPNPVQVQWMYSGFPELRRKLGPLSFQTKEDTKHPKNPHQLSHACPCAQSCKLSPAVRGWGEGMHHPITSQLPLPGSIIPLVQPVTGREVLHLS